MAALERHLTVEKQAKKSATSMTEKSALFGDDGLALDGSDADHFQLVIGLHKIHAKTKPTPERIPIPHSMRGEGAQLDVCLFAKDPESEWKSVVEEKGLGKIVTKVERGCAQ